MDGSSGSASGGMAGMIMALFMLVFVVLIIVSLWKVFTKAGQPGWACLVPVYNLYVMLQIAGKPGWWILLFFVPLVNLVVSFLLTAGIAEKFGKGMGFGLGLMFLGFIFYPILAFGDAQYQGTAPALPPA